jgi:hypothetical protein
VQRPRNQRVFLPYNSGQGSAATADFTVAKIDVVIAGRVTDAQGLPLSGARQRSRAGDAGRRQTTCTGADDGDAQSSRQMRRRHWLRSLWDHQKSPTAAWRAMLHTEYPYLARRTR